MMRIPIVTRPAALPAALVVFITEDLGMANADDNGIARSVAPTGTLRAAINYGNIVLAQKGTDGEPAGISADLARELGRRLKVPVSFTTSASMRFAAAAFSPGLSVRSWSARTFAKVSKPAVIQPIPFEVVEQFRVELIPSAVCLSAISLGVIPADAFAEVPQR